MVRRCWNWPERTGGSDAKMFEILPRDWNFKPIFTQKWASVDMNWGFNPHPPTIPTLWWGKNYFNFVDKIQTNCSGASHAVSNHLDSCMIFSGRSRRDGMTGMDGQTDTAGAGTVIDVVMDVGDTRMVCRWSRSHSMTLLARCRNALPVASLNLLRYTGSVSRLSTRFPAPPPRSYVSPALSQSLSSSDRTAVRPFRRVLQSSGLSSIHRWHAQRLDYALNFIIVNEICSCRINLQKRPHRKKLLICLLSSFW